MTLNLMKLGVGIESVQHLLEVQSRRLEGMTTQGVAPQLKHLTRHMPRRQKELLNGGSIYWVIKGVILVRQKLIGFKPTKRQNGEAACAILYEPEHTRTEPKKIRGFQGWRYLPRDKTPPDLDNSSQGENGLPVEMAQELRSLGLL